MIGFVSLLRSFGFSEGRFPFEECIFKDEREHGIKKSRTKYWVIVQYAEDENRFEAHLCTPYLYQKSYESEAYGGWQCVGSSDFFFHPAENWSENEEAVPVCFRLAEDKLKVSDNPVPESVLKVINMKIKEEAKRFKEDWLTQEDLREIFRLYEYYSKKE